MATMISNFKHGLFLVPFEWLTWLVVASSYSLSLSLFSFFHHGPPPMDIVVYF